MEQYIRVCPVCGVSFNARKGRSKKCKTYCSLVCSNKSRIRPLSKCPICGELFKSIVTTVGRQRYCSKKCGFKSRHGQPSPLKTPEHIIAYVSTHYPDGNIQSIADHLGLSYGAVQQIAQKAGVKRRLTEMCKTNSERMLAHNPMHNPETVNKVRQFYVDNPDKRNEVMGKLREGHARLNRDKPSKPELKCGQHLTELGIHYASQFIIKNKFVVDFKIGNIILQVDGEYWHGHPRFEPLTDRQTNQRKRDAAQDKYLTACGYEVVRVWERDITLDNLRRLLIK